MLSLMYASLIHGINEIAKRFLISRSGSNASTAKAAPFFLRRFSISR